MEGQEPLTDYIRRAVQHVNKVKTHGEELTKKIAGLHDFAKDVRSYSMRAQNEISSLQEENENEMEKAEQMAVLHENRREERRRLKIEYEESEKKTAELVRRFDERLTELKSETILSMEKLLEVKVNS